MRREWNPEEGKQIVAAALVEAQARVDRLCAASIAGGELNAQVMELSLKPAIASRDALREVLSWLERGAGHV